MPLHPALPATCSVAFKEWTGVCHALIGGRQSMILRKGGISEGPGGFRPEHPAFWLYPTSLHQQEQGLKPGVSSGEVTPEGHAWLSAVAVVASIHFVDQLEILDGLDPFHVWTSETVRARFRYRTPGLWVLGVRVFRREDPWRVPVTSAQLGCKSWVPLDEPLSTGSARPAVDDAEFRARMEALARILDPNVTDSRIH
jgi:hypothetical protein